jgi:hypothetical protein
MEAEQRNPGVLREKASANLAGKRAEGHAQSDFAIAQRHQTGKGSVQSDCRERDRSEREKRQQKRAKSILCVALGDVLSERHDIKDGTARLDLANLADAARISHCRARPGARFKSANPSVEAATFLISSTKDCICCWLESRLGQIRSTLDIYSRSNV